MYMYIQQTYNESNNQKIKSLAWFWYRVPRKNPGLQYLQKVCSILPTKLLKPKTPKNKATIMRERQVQISQTQTDMKSNIPKQR